MANETKKNLSINMQINYKTLEVFPIPDQEFPECSTRVYVCLNITVTNRNGHFS